MEKTLGYQSLEEKFSSLLGWFLGITSAVLLGTWWAILGMAASWLWN